MKSEDLIEYAVFYVNREKSAFKLSNTREPSNNKFI